jgi:Ca2+-binding EF-hand superfamily protein
MKSTQLILFAALVGTCSLATAQDKAKRPKRPIPEETLKKYDLDRDGKLSEAEHAAMTADRKAMEEKRRQAALLKYDKDGNGKLSEEERKMMRDELEATRKAFMEKYDTDKDGRLDRAEKKVAIDAGVEIPPGRGPGRPPGGKGGQDGPDDKEEAPPITPGT